MPYDEGGRLAELHELAGDLEREDTPDGVRVLVRLPAERRRPLRAVRAHAQAGSRMNLRVVRLDPRARAAHPGPSRRRRPRPVRARGGDARARASGRRSPTGIAVEIPRRPGRPGAAALGARRAARDRAGQRARADRRRLPRRAAGAAAQHRPRAPASSSPPATGSPSWCWSRVESRDGGRGAERSPTVRARRRRVRLQRRASGPVTAGAPAAVTAPAGSARASPGTAWPPSPDPGRRRRRPELSSRITGVVSSALTRSIVSANAGPSASSACAETTGTALPQPNTLRGSASSAVVAAGELAVGGVDVGGLDRAGVQRRVLVADRERP